MISLRVQWHTKSQLLTTLKSPNLAQRTMLTFMKDVFHAIIRDICALLRVHHVRSLPHDVLLPSSTINPGRMCWIVFPTSYPPLRRHSRYRTTSADDGVGSPGPRLHTLLTREIISGLHIPRTLSLMSNPSMRNMAYGVDWHTSMIHTYYCRY